MKKGFDRLKGVAAASFVSLGLLGGAGSARAATVSLSNLNIQKNGTTFGVYWRGIANRSLSAGTGLSVTTSSTISTSKTTYVTVLGASGFRVSSSKSAFGISDGQLVTGVTTTGTSFSGKRNAFDHALWLAVDQTPFANPDSTVDLTGDVLTTDNVVGIVPNIDANIRYYFAPNRNLVRALYTLTNTSAGDVTAEVRVGGNVGSGGRTFIQATSDGDLINEDSDLWHVTNDSNVTGDDGRRGPAITLTRCGAGAPVCPLNGVTLGHPNIDVDDFLYFYAVTVPANSSIRIMNFAELGILSMGLVTSATDFETLVAANSAGLLTGLTPTELSEIVNYGADADLDGVLDSADNCPDDANTTQTDTDIDGLGDACDAFPNDATETVDTDSDGVGDNTDAFPNDATETVDTDGDGVGDNGDNCPVDANNTQADADSDSAGDTCDAFPNDATEKVDTDGDGVGDNADAFPNDATETVDTDGDGVGDNADAFPDDASKTTASSGGSDGFLGIGSFSFSGLAVILGLLPVLRIRRKTKK